RVPALRGFSALRGGVPVLSSSFAEQTPCLNGFDSEVFTFKVHRPYLHRGRKLGRVLFNDCAGRGYNIFSSTDQHFQVDIDGTVELKTQLTLHEVQRIPLVHRWDFKGNESINVLKLRRMKRWSIPPLNIPENQRGPFPKEIAVLKTKFVKETKMIYSITGEGADQTPVGVFTINKNTGWLTEIRVMNTELMWNEVISRLIYEHHLFQNYPEYTLLIQAADMMGSGHISTGTAVITVTDSNDQRSNSFGHVPENKVGAVVVKLPVTDGDEPQSPAWMAKFRIISGNNGGFFSISTGPNKQEGIITAPLDFEQNNKYTLLVIAENEVPFAKPLQTSTATVIVNVQDVNEAPVFDPVEHIISKPEDLEVGTEITVYTATDPDTARTQTVTYRISSEDRAGWVSVDRDTGLIRVKSSMDRESPFVKDGKYKVLILAVDNVPATGTGTLVIELEDVNDNAPVVEEREIKVCNKDSVPVSLSATDKDGPRFAAPFTVELQGDGRNNWTARMNDSNKIILTLKTAIQQGKYNVVLRVYDSGLHHQDSTILASVCDCTGEDFSSSDCRGGGAFFFFSKGGGPFGGLITGGFFLWGGIVGAVLALLSKMIRSYLESYIHEEPLLSCEEITAAKCIT
uniref:Cadherin domain-containing protein n=1 Tax=Astyanax mexicanus TaxID=7994 RepID=A0A3B1KAL5_ASTMX